MKFKGILNEAYIDTLPLHKMDKHILKKMYQDNIDNLKDRQVSSYIKDRSIEYAIDIDRIVKMYLTYKKYKDFLFSEHGIEIVETFDVLSNELKELTREKVLESIFNNYNEKQVYNSDGITVTVTFNEGLEGAIEDELGPEVWVRMPVSGEYKGIVRGGGRKGEEYTVDDTTFYGSVYLSVLPNVTSNSYGYDFLNFADDSFGDWMIRFKNSKYSDTIDSGKVKGSMIPIPKNYSEGELKKYADKWVEMCIKIIKKNTPILQEYKDFVEHGGIFEGYNRKQKLKK